MSAPAHNRYESPKPLSELASPPCDEVFQRAHAQAIQRLFERRCEWSAQKVDGHDVRRRTFLKSVVAGAAGLVSWGIVGRSVLEASGQRSVPAGGDAHPKRWSDMEEVARFAWETLLFQCGQYATAHVADLCAFPVGNASTKRCEVDKSTIEACVKTIGEGPRIFAELYGTVGIVVPVMEELLFRIVPSHLLFKEGMQWSVGIPANFAYAALHNLIPLDKDSKRSVQLTDRAKLSLDIVPLPQFMLGAYCWYVMKRYGDWAPFVAHAVNNQGLALSLVWGGRETYREYQELLAEELKG